MYDRTFIRKRSLWIPQIHPMYSPFDISNSSSHALPVLLDLRLPSKVPVPFKQF